MRTGYVPTSWAEREHNAWVAREVARTAANPASPANRAKQRPTKTG
jgi:cytochrome b subunit of formate dehydrogenase